MPKRDLGNDLIEALEQAIALEHGDTKGHVRIRRVPRTARDSAVPAASSYSPDRVFRLRARLKFSQSVFAWALNVSPETVRAWEQGKRHPDGAALRLLELIEKQPELLLSLIKERPQGHRKRKAG